MGKSVAGARERLSIDVLPEEHRQIKTYAALHGQSIREFVTECIREHLRQEKEARNLSSLTTNLDKDPVLESLWNNPKDSAYDKL